MDGWGILVQEQKNKSLSWLKRREVFIMERLDLPITGICSFGKYPICTDLNHLNADIAVLGVPYDLGVGFLSGARLGPRRIREASTQYARGDAGFYDYEDDKQYLNAPLKIMDCGDTDVLQGDLEFGFESIEAYTRKIIQRKAIPIILGGDHSISIPIGRALSEYQEKICVIQFDAHLDWKSHTGRQYLGNGSPMRRLSEMEHIGQMVQIGLRGIGSSTKEDFQDALKYGSCLITSQEAKKIGTFGVLQKIPKADAYYLTIDIDGFDMSIAPGVASPYPGGLLFEEVTEVIKGIAKMGRIIGADVVEVAPQYDPTGNTVRLAALTMLEVMAQIGEQLKKK